jgi:hypothetical protein
MNEVNSDMLKYFVGFSTSCGIFTVKTPQKCFEKCVGQTPPNKKCGNH